MNSDQRKAFLEGEEGRYARATMDCSFKAVMANERVRLAIIRDFIGRQDIVATKPLSTALPKLRRIDQTQRHQDFVCEFQDGSKCLLEMQVTKQSGWNNRAFFHASYTFIDQLQKGGNWESLYPVIAINFLNFKTGLITKPGTFENRFKLIDTLNYAVVLPQIDMTFLELPSVQLPLLINDI